VMRVIIEYNWLGARAKLNRRVSSLSESNLCRTGVSMKTAIFLLGGVLVTSILFMSEGASLYDSERYDSDYEDFQDVSLNKTNCTGGIHCYFFPWPFPVCCTFVFP